MLTAIWSFFGWKEAEPPPSPPSVTIIGVRIPADGSPAHLLELTTMSASDATDGFLFHIPDLRQYWTTELAWHQRDLLRLDLQQDDQVQLSQHLRQNHHLKQLLQYWKPLDRQSLFLIRQRYLLDQRYHFLHQHQASCVGTYYVMYSFCLDDLPKNSFVPTWISDVGDGRRMQYHGDMFVVKMAPQEYGEHEWAAYADVTPEFLKLLVQGPRHGCVSG